ncbi:MAG: prolyl oligopeptidase family serine peptidase [Acidobacteriota bacterium]
MRTALLAAVLAACGSKPPPTPPQPPPPPAPHRPPVDTVAQPPPPVPTGPPRAAKQPVTDTYWGQTVTDDYRWLENASSPTVQEWSDAENKYTREHLDKLPQRAELHARIAQILEHQSKDYFALSWHGGQLFALESQPPKQRPFVVVMKSAMAPDQARVLVDPNALDPSGSTSIDFFQPSLDGKLVAVSLSKNGSEDGTLHVYDVATGKERGEPIPRVNGGTAGGSVAWTAKGFYYTRYPHEGERAPADADFYQQVYFHADGTPVAKDTYAIGKDFPRIAEVALSSSDDGRYVLANVANGDGGEHAFYVLAKGTWTKLADFPDKVVQSAWGRDAHIYLLSRAGAPRGKLVRVTATQPQLAKAQVVVPEGAGSIASFEASARRLWVKKIEGGPSTLEWYPLAGGKPTAVAIPPVSTVGQIAHLGGDEILFRDSSYVVPPLWLALSPKDKEPKKTGMFVTSPVEFSDTEVTQTFCSSKDGTKVPIAIARKKDAPKPGPTLLYGYGGYGINMEPRFLGLWRIWLDAGGTYAVASLRGGAELGETWHEQGKLTHKQNVFDDFAACAEMLHRDYAGKDQLAILGGSNGGLLMGAELTQHPDLYRAVVSFVGIYDMLRVELAPNGAFNVTEFGTVKDKDQFAALYAYSPYHHVVDGTKYPAVLMLTGAHDPRVDPYHSRKMTARLQAASASGLPILLRTSGKTGHGIGTPLSESIDQWADVFAFLFEQLGLAR